MLLITSCHTTPIVIKEPKVYKFSELDPENYKKIIETYAHQVREFKTAYDDLKIQIEAADGTRIIIIRDDLP